jgi:hypothetical protein
MNLVQALIANPIVILVLAVIAVINWRLTILLITSAIVALILLGGLYLIAR